MNINYSFPLRTAVDFSVSIFRSQIEKVVRSTLNRSDLHIEIYLLFPLVTGRDAFENTLHN